MKIKSSKIIKFIQTAYKVARRSIATYSNKFSKHRYTQPQHVSLLCLKQRLRLRYREFVDLIEEMPGLKGELVLDEIPHFTTLQKFFQKISSVLFDRILNQTLSLFDINNPWIAIDGTGHSSSHASTYYAKKLKKQKKKRRKGYTKNCIAVDTDRQVIVAQRTAKGPRHDRRDAIPLIRKSRGVKPKGYSMDKAFDDEEIHRVVREEAHAKCMIPIKKNREKTGKYRLSMLTDFNEDEYHRRSLVETVISVEKRVLDDVNYSRTDRMRNKESKLRNICYNIYKYAMIFILETRFYFTETMEDFYKA
jgi:hypothetical protein